MSKKNAPAKMPDGRRKIDFKMLGRVVKLLFRSYPRLVPLAMCCMLLSAYTVTAERIPAHKRRHGRPVFAGRVGL